MNSLFPPKFVFDTGSLILLRHYPVDVFPTVWKNIDQLFASGEAVSCREVYNELVEKFDGEDDVKRWAKSNAHFFTIPAQEELVKVSDILQAFPKLVSEDVFLSTKPQADPFVIARSVVLGCTLIHEEKFKPNAPKIPNVCKHYKVNEMKLHDFFRKQGWSF